MEVILIMDGIEEKTLDFRGTGKELLEKLNINPETVLLTKNDELINNDEVLENGDKIKIVSVISGG